MMSDQAGKVNDMSPAHFENSLFRSFRTRCGFFKLRHDISQNAIWHSLNPRDRLRSKKFPRGLFCAFFKGLCFASADNYARFQWGRGEKESVFSIKDLSDLYSQLTESRYPACYLFSRLLRKRVGLIKLGLSLFSSRTRNLLLKGSTDLKVFSWMFNF